MSARVHCYLATPNNGKMKDLEELIEEAIEFWIRYDGKTVEKKQEDHMADYVTSKIMSCDIEFYNAINKIVLDKFQRFNEDK